MFLLAVMFLIPSAVFSDIPFRYNFEKHPMLSDCLLKIAQDQVKTKKIVFLAEELNGDSNLKSITQMDWDKVIVSTQNVSSVSGLYVFLPDDNTTVSYKKIMKGKHLDYESQYIICTDNMHSIFSFFEVAWANKIVDAIALYPSHTTRKISVYTYIPFGEWGCSNTDPVRINIYDPDTGAFEEPGSVFSERGKLFNLHQCPVRVILKDKPLRVIKDSGEMEFNTMALRLFNFLKLKMNFTPEAVQIDKEANTYAAAYYNFTSASILNIVQGDSEMAVGRFSQLIDYHEDAASPAKTGMDCFTWAVPVKAGTKPSVWTTSLFEFDYLTWILVIFVFCVSILVLRLILQFTQVSYSNPTLALVGILLSISVNMKMKSEAMKVFVAHWLLFCLVVVAAYSASLGSLVTVPPDSSDIKTTSELLDKDITLTGDPKMYHILSASSDTSTHIKRVLDKFVILRPSEFDKVIYDIYTNRNKAVFYTKSKLIQEENRVRSDKQTSNLVHIVPQCLISSHTSPLVMRKGSVLMRPVKEILVRLLESGILNYWTYLEEEEIKISTPERSAQKFTLSQLRGALIVIISGHVIAASVFAYEIYSNKVKVITHHEKPKKRKFIT